MRTFLSTQPAMFESAKRRGDTRIAVRIDPYRSSVKRASNAPRLCEISGPNASCETVDGPIRLTNEIVFTFKWQNAENGTEDFLLAEAGRIVESVDNRGQVVRSE